MRKSFFVKKSEIPFSFFRNVIAYFLKGCEKMKLTVLGCLGAYPYKGEGTTSYLLESDGFQLLIDAGSTTLVELEKHLDPLALDAVILSHYHFDHIADLGVLQYYWQLSPGEKKQPLLPIYGHGQDEIHFKALTMPNVSQGFDYLKEQQLDLGPFTVTFLQTVHPVTCYAMRFVEKKTDKVFVFTGDSGYLETLNEFALSADLLLADTYLFEGHEYHHAHLTSKEAGQLAKVANVQHLVLTHLPQIGDLDLLAQQAQQAAEEDVTVTVAKVRHTYTI